MLEKPDLDESVIKNCLQNEFGFDIQSVEFLPLGADLDTVVYRAQAKKAQRYFIKLRRGRFSTASVSIPKYLADQGLKQIIAPFQTLNGALWTNLGSFQLTVYRYVAGKNGFERGLTTGQRIELGQALRLFHRTTFPGNFTDQIHHEQFSPRWRNQVVNFLSQLSTKTYSDPLATELATFLLDHRRLTEELVSRAEQLGEELLAAPADFVLCHGDIHGWNMLLDDENNLYIVDWDTLIFAPKERDLMFVGSGLGGRGQSLADEVRLFYQGYGDVTLNEAALAYYRYERIVEDIAIYCDQLLLSTAGGDDRQQALNELKSNYLPGRTIDLAFNLDKSRG